MEFQVQDYYADEVGVLSPNQLQVEELFAGEVENLILLGLVIDACFFNRN